MEHLGTSEERRLRAGSLSAPDVPLKEAGSPWESDSSVLRKKATLPGCGGSEVQHLEASPLKGLEVVSAGSSACFLGTQALWVVGCRGGQGPVTSGKLRALIQGAPECLGPRSVSRGGQMWGAWFSQDWGQAGLLGFAPRVS